MEYRKNGTNYTFWKYSGSDRIFKVPYQWEGTAVTAVGPKAFLSCKTIQSLYLPDSIDEIGDWAFAHMKNLEKITLPAREMQLGKEIFMDCTKLQQIALTNNASGNWGIPFFLASAATTLKERNLFNPKRAGDVSEHVQWLKDFDNALLRFLDRPDDYGFEPIFYGWYEDEDADSCQRPVYIKQRRRDKVKLCFLRLLYPGDLESCASEHLKQYLADHMPGGKLEAEHTLVWEMMCQDYSHDRRYLQVLADAGCITHDNLPVLMDERCGMTPEVIAFLLQYQQEISGTYDYFDDFTI